jgi:ABC-2 type transport system permease protein
MRVLRIQSWTEIKLWLRRRETVFFSLLLPVMFLAFFGALYGSQTVSGSGGIKYISYMVPGYAVFATMAVALGTVTVNLATERRFGILKRLGGTPLPRPVLILAKMIAGGVLIAAVVAVLVLVGTLVYGAHLRGNWLEALVILMVGIICFAVMGIVLGGFIPPDSAVAVGTLVYLALSFLGGVFIPLDQFPAGLQNVAKALPSERMADALQTIWTKGEGITNTGWDLPILAAWALATLVVGGRRFRWE